MFAVLSMVKVRVLRAPKPMDDGAKALENPGRSAATVRSAVALPLLPALDVRSPDTFVWVPGTLLVVATVMAQAAKPGTTPPLRLMVSPPFGAVTSPPHVDTALAGIARITPAGRVSVNARSVTGAAD